MLWQLIRRLVKQKFFISIVFLEIAFVATIMSSHVNTKSPIILPEYLPFLQVQVLGFQVKSLSHKIFFQIFAITPTFISIPLLILITISAIKFTFTFT